jgi:hypothetical protein
VDEPSDGINSDNAEEPQDYKYDGNGYEHGILLIIIKNYDYTRIDA